MENNKWAEQLAEKREERFSADSRHLMLFCQF